jgi:L-ascorbate metabolism protein UlaG (beta-lactamase superfamily)
MRITYFGHACFLIETVGKKLLFDPFISPNPKTKEAGIDIASIEADYILLSHGHEDHIADAETIGKASDALVIGVYEVVAWMQKKGLRGHGMNTGGKWTFDFGTIKLVNAVHSSAMPDGSYGGNPVGFVITNTEGCFYFAGDTGLTLDMQLIPMTCPPLDFAILPIGDNFTMGYEDAVLASDFIKCNTVIGCHFDTFPPVEIEHDAAQKEFENKGKTLLLPKLNKSYNISK